MYGLSNDTNTMTWSDFVLEGHFYWYEWQNASLSPSATAELLLHILFVLYCISRMQMLKLIGHCYHVHSQCLGCHIRHLHALSAGSAWDNTGVKTAPCGSDIRRCVMVVISGAIACCLLPLAVCMEHHHAVTSCVLAAWHMPTLVAVSTMVVLVGHSLAHFLVSCTFPYHCYQHSTDIHRV